MHFTQQGYANSSAPATTNMPHLDASALEQDVDGVALLRSPCRPIATAELQSNLHAPSTQTRPTSSTGCYITRLFTDEAHLIAGPGITDIRQLAGKRVNFDLEGSGANYTGRLIFERLGIPVGATNVDQPPSYEMLKRGELAARSQMSGKPIPAIANLRG